MFTFYSSICQLFKSKSNNSLRSHPSVCSLTQSHLPYVNKDYYDMMLSPSSSISDFLAMNENGEMIIVEYPKFDKSFMHYRPKSKKFKKENYYY
tara:strand:- start:2666 stop:2947 length:282 start_codon:yes stop_codon:yes gene_type:complete